MNQKAKTKDERFILTLHASTEKEDSQWTSINPYSIGDKLGQSQKVVKTIVRLLAQANFVKKWKDNSISLTEKGEELVSILKSNFSLKAVK